MTRLHQAMLGAFVLLLILTWLGYPITGGVWLGLVVGAALYYLWPWVYGRRP